MNYSGVDAVRVIEILSPTGGTFGEYLLVFQTLAIYVDLQGRKSRDREIMYPAFPTYISKYYIVVLLLFSKQEFLNPDPMENDKKFIVVFVHMDVTAPSYVHFQIAFLRGLKK